MAEPKNISLVLVNWNGKNDTLTCLKSLEHLEKGDHHVHIIVVDNGSTDGSVAAISEKYPTVNIIESPDNTGFTGGNNLGIELALTQEADIVWLLNNDTHVDPKALLPLITELSTKDVGIVGSKIYFMHGREFHKDRYKDSEKGKVLWYAGGVIDWKNDQK
jgi:GT2 family glycosyltransferase